MLSLRSSVLWLFVGGGLASVACGDDDGGSDPVPTGGKGGGAGLAGSGGAKTGGAGGVTGGLGGNATGGGGATGGSATTGGTSAGGGSGGTTGGSATGGTAPSGAAGMSAGEGGMGEAGSSPGGQAGGGAGGAGEGGEGGTDEEVGGGGGGGEAGQAALSPQHLYVGCADSSGTIQAYLFNGASLSPIGTTLTGGAISNSTLNGDQDLAYVAHASSNGETKISTYTRNTTSGALTPLGTPADVPLVAPSDGSGGEAGAPSGVTAPGPQTLTLDNNEDFLAVPNYFSNNVYVYEVLGNGSVGGIVSDDSGGEKAHHSLFSNNNNFMLVPYLGSDQITAYAFDDATGEIVFDSDETMPEDDSGPRHIALHPNGTWLYAIHETAGGADSEAGLIDFFTFNQGNGDITHQDAFEVPVPDGYTGVKNGSEIALSPSGEFLYVSMRLDSSAEGSIVVYEVETGGTLSFVQQVSSRGVTPRHFALSSDGRLLAVGNQNSDTVALFTADNATGELTFLDDRDVCDSPRFARFADVQD